MLIEDGVVKPIDFGMTIQEFYVLQLRCRELYGPRELKVEYVKPHLAKPNPQQIEPDQGS